jgi:tRNA threonylcarbamoyl adenosine modification protein YeaZ
MKSRNILFVNTLTKNAGMTISQNGKLFQAKFGERHDYSRDVIKVFDAVLKKTKLKPADLSGVVVLVGPGSYTSIRIGVSFANALGYAQNIPVVGMTLFDALGFEAGKTLIVEAGRGNVFFKKGKKEGVLMQDKVVKLKDRVVALEPSKELKKAMKQRLVVTRLSIPKVLKTVVIQGTFSKPVAAHYILPPNVQKAKKK